MNKEIIMNEEDFDTPDDFTNTFVLVDLIKALEQENAKLKKSLEKQKQQKIEIGYLKENYKSRIDKAIEYIEKHTNTTIDCDHYFVETKDLLEILRDNDAIE